MGRGGEAGRLWGRATGREKGEGRGGEREGREETRETQHPSGQVFMHFEGATKPTQESHHETLRLSANNPTPDESRRLFLAH